VSLIDNIPYRNSAAVSELLLDECELELWLDELWLLETELLELL